MTPGVAGEVGDVPAGEELIVTFVLVVAQTNSM
jgi:hypothetical protein